jgi:hypothetical protein
VSERLNEVRLAKRPAWERLDPLDNAGVSTYALTGDAIAARRNGLAKDLVDYLYFWEIKLAGDANIDLADGLPQFYMTVHGEDGFDDVYRDVMARAVYDPAARWPPRSPLPSEN